MSHFFFAALLCLACLPGLAQAAGGMDPTPPTPSETTETCDDGLIWDLATQSCLPPDESSNDDSARLGDIRELAYAGRYADALVVLDTLADPQAPMALTYYGFAHRKAGDSALAMQYYRAALAADPDNLLARSYMGQGHVAAGEMHLATAQLSEIRARGGRGSWPETALRLAIATGAGAAY